MRKGQRVQITSGPYVNCSATIRGPSRELSIGQDVLNRPENLYRRGLRLLAAAERAKNHFACIGYLRELRGTLVALYEVAAEVAPRSTQVKVLPEAYVQAVNRALGISGILKPLDNRQQMPTAPVVEVAPVKQLPASVTTQSNDDEFDLENLP